MERKEFISLGRRERGNDGMWNKRVIKLNIDSQSQEQQYLLFLS